MNPVDFEMARRLARIEDMYAGKTVYLPPSINLDCGHLVYTHWWYQYAGFTQTPDLNRWVIPVK